jgi:peptide-methionine (S)-S-oxide reductase
MTMIQRLRNTPGAIRAGLTAGFALTIALHGSCARAGGAARLPPPTLDAARATKAGKETVVVSGGCFWGVQAVFQHVKGVTEAVSGYAGGEAKTATYDQVSTGDTGHAESVRVTFDPAQVTFGQLLDVFFSVAHDPTEVNHQGPDDGTQYRTMVFTTSPEQKRIADAYIAQLDRAKLLHGKIATGVVPLTAFYNAEAYHQNYATLHPESPYIIFNDAPKVVNLHKLFPEMYQADPSQVAVPHAQR